MWNNSLRELWNISLRSMWNEICPHSRQRIFHICGANISQQSYFTCLKGKFRWKKPNAIALGFFLGRGGRTRSRRYDAKPSFWFRLCYAPRSSAALTVHRTVIHYRSPSSPPQIVSQQKEKAHEKSWTLSFWQGREDSNPRPTVLEWLRGVIKPWNCSLFRTFQRTFQAKPRVVIVSEKIWCFFDDMIKF